MVAAARDAAGAAQRDLSRRSACCSGCTPREETPARTPWWLLALRLLAAALVILALARPVLDAGSALPGAGPLLLVIDNGWASAADWPRRMQAADTVLDRAERAGRQAALLATAPDGAGAAPQATAPMPVADLRARLAALQPEALAAGPRRRGGGAARLAPARRGGRLSRRRADATAADFAAFAAALGAPGR